uniref:Uncharacterized protein n=1 Tax=Megaselia scalaris TaxID=36166 RepID=T1GYJ1_MEGSC
MINFTPLASKKIQLQAQATFLSDGYAAHLNNLQALGGSRPAQGNARMVIPRGCFNLPGQPRRRSKETPNAVAVASPIRSGYFKRKTYLSHV